MHIYIVGELYEVIGLAILRSFQLIKTDSKEEFKKHFEKWMHSWNDHKPLQEDRHVLLHLEAWVCLFKKKFLYRHDI